MRSPPGDLPNPGIKPRPPTLQADSLPVEPPGKPKNTGVNSLSLLKRIFLTQESNQALLHCRWILYQLSHQRSKQDPQTGSPLLYSNSLTYNCSSMTKYTVHIKGLIPVKGESKSPKQGLNLSF